MEARNATSKVTSWVRLPRTMTMPKLTSDFCVLVSEILLGTFVLVGCGGSYPAPTERTATTTAAVRAATEVGGEKEPQAALHLKLAQEQLEQAKKLMADGENKRAEYVLMRADSDAELAVALARQDTAKKQAKVAQEEVRTLKSGQ